MLNKLLPALAAVLATTAFAAVDANKASQAELEAINGIGPTVSANIVAERKKGDFKDWNDLFKRVQGVGDRSAAKFSAGGLTINGKPYDGAPYVEPTKAQAGAKTASAAPGSGTAAASPPAATARAAPTKKTDKGEAKAQKPAPASAAGK